MPRAVLPCFHATNNTYILLASPASPSVIPPPSPPMNAVASPSSCPVQLQSAQHPVPSWEFTRRKRWADLIVTELSEAIVLVLSPGRKVLYCNPSVREMLGWLDDDLVDQDFTELVNGRFLPRSSLPSSSSTVSPVQRTTVSVSVQRSLTLSRVSTSCTSMCGYVAIPIPPSLTWRWLHHHLRKRSSLK